MKYFLDTEFIERPGSIQLISIGIVAEDGREYYQIARGFDYQEVWCDDWLRQNVISQILSESSNGYGVTPDITYDSMVQVFESSALWTHEIAKEVLDLIGDDSDPKFYGYYADYDWVVFCWLFGRMIDLPKNFPMYCRDLKQMLAERELGKGWVKSMCPQTENEHNALADARWNKKLYEAIKNDDFHYSGI